MKTQLNSNLKIDPAVTRKTGNVFRYVARPFNTSASLKVGVLADSPPFVLKTIKRQNSLVAMPSTLNSRKSIELPKFKKLKDKILNNDCIIMANEGGFLDATDDDEYQDYDNIPNPLNGNRETDPLKKPNTKWDYKADEKLMNEVTREANPCDYTIAHGQKKAWFTLLEKRLKDYPHAFPDGSFPSAEICQKRLTLLLSNQRNKNKKHKWESGGTEEETKVSKALEVSLYISIYAFICMFSS
jgi:hypothetical protein